MIVFNKKNGEKVHRGVGIHKRKSEGNHKGGVNNMGCNTGYKIAGNEQRNQRKDSDLPEGADAKRFGIPDNVFQPISIGRGCDAEIYGGLEMAEHIKKVK